ncbi:MAG: large-conductance mechanosensitive channel protein MscL [Oscillospiraceae bacterium]|nr:large-conductance mechanosensitive channel protein MscL [Oscillospiraceae bacterium]
MAKKQTKRRARRVLDEFKSFAVKGNVVDLAVGVIIGGAFGKITTSLVGDVFMPLVGTLLGGVDFSQLNLTLPSMWPEKEPVSLNLGNFVSTVVDFALIAVCVFFLVKIVGILRRKATADSQPPAPQQPPPPTPEILLLAEIRDLLKQQTNAPRTP